MKNLIRNVIFGSLALCSSNAICQQSATLDQNNLNVTINYTGQLFTNLANQMPAFEAPKGSGIHSAYASFIWVGGYSPNQEITVAANSYGRNDFQSGPILDDPTEYTNTVSNWERVWKVTKAEIDNHIINFNNSGYVVPNSIAEWPVHGVNNVNTGHANYLAPFYDANLDGIYNPELGDYPLINGADEGVWFIINDELQGIDSLENNMGVEIGVLVYSYYCTQDDGVNNSIFVDYNIINKSSLQYDSVYVGIMTDFDIGNSTDDYIGCDVATSTMYAYNSSNFDQGQNGSLGYEDKSAALGLTILKGPKQDNDGADNIGPAPINNYSTSCDSAINNGGICYQHQASGYSDGIIDNENLPLKIVNNQAILNQTNINYYDALSYNLGTINYPGTNISTKLIYPGESDPEGYAVLANSFPNWSETTQNNSPGERRVVGSMGPFTFAANQGEKIQTAYVFARDLNSISNTESVDLMLARVQQVKLFHSNGNTCQDYSSVLNLEEVGFNIYPNPFTNSFRIELNEVNNDTEISIINMLGKEVKQIITNQIETEINLSKYSSGIYFVKVKQGDVISTKKIIKN